MRRLGNLALLLALLAAVATSFLWLGIDLGALLAGDSLEQMARYAAGNKASSQVDRGTRLADTASATAATSSRANTATGVLTATANGKYHTEPCSEIRPRR